MDLVDRVRSLSESPVSDRVLRERVLAEVRTQVPFDGHVFALTDPVSGVVSSPHATLPMVSADRLPELIAKRYECLGISEWAGWLAREFHVIGVARVLFSDRYGEWGFLELWRTDAAFRDSEGRAVAAVTSVLTHRLRQAVASYFRPDPREEGLPKENASALRPGVIILDRSLRVKSETSAAAQALLRLLPPDAAAPPVPAVAFNVGAALLAERRRGSRREESKAWTRVHLGGGRMMTARADELDDTIAVSISPCTTAERIELFTRAHGLSPRENEVFDLAVQGRTSREIAAQLTIAPSTAEDHLRALLAKTQSTSRAQLMVRAIGR